METEKRPKDKLKTQEEFMDAIGYILATDGYNCLGINKTAKLAGRSKAGIYTHFGDFEGLKECYVRSKDYWLNKVQEVPVFSCKESLIDFLSDALQQQLEYLYEHRDSQTSILWEMNVTDQFFNKINRDRENLIRSIMEAGRPYISNTGLDVGVISTLISGGVKQLVIQSARHPGTQFGLEINIASDRAKILDTIRQLVILAIG